MRSKFSRQAANKDTFRGFQMRVFCQKHTASLLCFLGKKNKQQQLPSIRKSRGLISFLYDWLLPTDEVELSAGKGSGKLRGSLRINHAIMRTVLILCWQCVCRNETYKVINKSSCQAPLWPELYISLERRNDNKISNYQSGLIME